MDLSGLRDLWDQHGRADALWAVVSDPSRTGRAWDRAAFFESGRRHADETMRRLERHGLAPASRARCLDFGCGVGRVTQGFAAHFDTVVGVDIAPSMIELARRFSSDGRLEFVVNDRDDLAVLGDGRFDLVHSTIVLQHIPGEAARRYVAELVRVLAPGGVAVLQVPHAPRPAAPAVPLPAAAFSARLELASPAPAVLRCGEAATVEVRIANTSPVAWPAKVEGDGACHVRVANHWRLRSGEVVAPDDGRVALGQDIGPGAEGVLALTVVAPGTPGRYVLEIDLVQEMVTWFAERGSPVLEVPVEVRRRSIAERAAARVRAWRTRPPGPTPAPFGMYAVPRHDVEAIITGAGGEVVAVEEDVAAGPDWISYTYFVRRPVV